MSRPITLFTGQWADLPLVKLAEMAKGWGYDGLELACWGDHFDVDKALSDDKYCQTRHDILGKFGLKVFAISTHLVGQAICDVIDERHSRILPPDVWGDGVGPKVQERAAQKLVATAKAAKKLGVKVVNGFTGSSIWPKIYAFPPTTPEEYEAGFADFAARFTPILNEFKKLGIKFALEVHPTEIAFDLFSAKKAVAAVKGGDLDGHGGLGLAGGGAHVGRGDHLVEGEEGAAGRGRLLLEHVEGGAAHPAAAEGWSGRRWWPGGRRGWSGGPRGCAPARRSRMGRRRPPACRRRGRGGPPRSRCGRGR